MTTPGEEHEVLAEPPIDALVVPNEGTDAVRGFIPVLGKTRAPVRQGLLVYVARPALLRHCGGKQYTGRQPDEVLDQTGSARCRQVFGHLEAHRKIERCGNLELLLQI